MSEAISNFLSKTGIAAFMGIGENGLDKGLWLKYLAMYVIIGALFYLAVVKKFEPLLLLPIAFGMLLANLPAANLMHMEFFFDEPDLVMATDPDADRIGIAVPNENGEYVLLNGNETGCILLYYILIKKKESGDLKSNATAVKTIVTTDLIFDMARDFLL